MDTYHQRPDIQGQCVVIAEVGDSVVVDDMAEESNMKRVEYTASKAISCCRQSVLNAAYIKRATCDNDV